MVSRGREEEFGGVYGEGRREREKRERREKEGLMRKGIIGMML